jgi:hypothetical protein
MALPSSGQIIINDIRNEVGTSNGSLGYLGSVTGLASYSNVAMSLFYGYSNVTYTLQYTNVALGDMCGGEFKDIYYGSDGVYYYTNVGGGGGYTPLYNSSLYWYIYQYYEPFFDAYVWEGFETNSSSTVFNNIGNYLSPCSPY